MRGIHKIYINLYRCCRHWKPATSSCAKQLAT
uniref:Uncharacterized protein n=1 Tax=Zea mays TaxID=4577 RepID=C4IYF7_MAIZE|nr:unknown [Zea mays]